MNTDLDILGTLSPIKYPPFPPAVKSMRGTHSKVRCIRANYNGGLHGRRQMKLLPLDNLVRNDSLFFCRSCQNF